MTRVTNPIRIATIREITATVVLIAEYSVLLLSVIAASLLSIVSDYDGHFTPIQCYNSNALFFGKIVTNA